MTLWGVRSGKYGERESLALERGRAIIGWEDLPDLSHVTTREDLRTLLFATYPEDKPKTVINWESQIWPFVHVMQTGDPIVMPLKTRSAFAVGRVSGPYQYEEIGNDKLHTRSVDWTTEIARSALAQDLQYSFGAFLTVFQVARNQAEARILAVLSGKRDPALSGKATKPDNAHPIGPAAIVDPGPERENIEEIAADEIRQKIGTIFKGHKLTALVASILETQGYRVVTSPAGPDGGVDILAGRGPLGFDAPRLVVQIKSQDGPVDVSVLRELQGVMRQFGAEQGLLVAWGGVTRALAKEAQRLFFEVRLWDAGDVVRAVQGAYDQLREDIQSDLPLKRIWVLTEQEP